MDNSDLEAKKAKLEKHILDFVMPKVKAGEMPFEDFQDISAALLTLMDGVEVEGQLSVILFVLSEKWPILEPLFREAKVGEISAREEGGKDEHINAIRDKLLKFSEKN